MPKTVVLCILDGWGHRENGPDNAIAHAYTPFWSDLLQDSSTTLLEASELNVGLPKGQMGNSEVGHMNIGAGRVILQDLPRIDESIQKETLKREKSLKDFIATLEETKGTCHLLGLLSPGGIHSHERHLKSLAEIIANAGVPVAIHAFLDGRDTPPKSAKQYVSDLIKFIEKHPLITLATIGGRYYGMDRDKRWERIQPAYESIIDGKPSVQDPLLMIEENYAKGITDEFIPPIAIGAYAGVKDGDGLLMGNFRADRARQILTALLDPNFHEFEKSKPVHFSSALGLIEYSEALDQWMESLFPAVCPQDVLGSVIADHGLKQLRLAETEKYAHVTFFFNGGREEVFPGEDRILVPSPKVATYDLKPEMSAYELTDSLVKAIENQAYTLIVINYANTDMVGHTGNFKAAQQAVEVVDICLGKIRQAVEKTGATLIITADHGNAEMMFDDALDLPHTAHTLNPVPFILFQGPGKSVHPGTLADIAPTILEILHLPQPTAMTGKSLLEKKNA